MSRKKISTTIYVTPEQSEKLKLLHERTKVPVAVYIREGIDLVLRHYSNLLPGQLPLDGGRSEQRPGTGSYGQRSFTASGRSADAGDSDDVEPEPSPSAPSASLGGHAAHAAAKK
jgi:Ribbon-helix-helix domain